MLRPFRSRRAPLASRLPLVLGRIVFVASAAAAAWAAGCADQPEPASPNVDAGDDGSSEADVSPVDAGGDATLKLDCANDLDDSGIWKHLECSGLYASLADKTVAADVKPYKPGIEFWSDGAEKQRWVYLPPGSTIDIGDFDEWKFPRGTKLWKEFKLGGKRIETRLFRKLEDGTWVHTSYRWNADESGAVSQNGGEKIPGLGPDGGPYEIPTAGQCDVCHRGKADQVLGFDAVSLGLATATGQTLEVLAATGSLSATPPKTTLAFPGTDAASAAVGWIHTNCGACHNDNANAAASYRSHFRVRATDLAPVDGGAPTKLEQLDVWTQAYCKNTFRTDPEAGAPYKYIRGGNPGKSLMSILAGNRAGPDEIPGPGVQMPPIVSRAVDHAGLQQVNDWIATLPECGD